MRHMTELEVLYRQMGYYEGMRAMCTDEDWRTYEAIIEKMAETQKQIDLLTSPLVEALRG